MELVVANDRQRLKKIKKLYKMAFPKAEQKPFWLFRALRNKGIAEIFSIEIENKFCGLAIMIFYRDIVLLDYFAIVPGRRGSGVGAKALGMLKDMYSDKRFFLEIEDPEVMCDNASERSRRKNFYINNGMEESDLKVDLFSQEMVVLTDGCNIEFDEYIKIYEKMVGKYLARKNVKDRSITVSVNS